MSAENDVLAAIGAIQTVIENFPFNIYSAMNVKTYHSSMDFLTDALRTVGVSDKDIIQFVLEELIGVNDISVEKLEDMDERDEKFQNNGFVQGLESAFKSLLSAILANIVSCSVWPKIPQKAIDSGIDLPIKIIDPMGHMDVCPTTPSGMRMYTGIKKGMTPYDLVSASTDMNAFMWYCLNMADPISGETWHEKGARGGGSICKITNRGYKKLRLYVDNSFSGKTLYRFNKEYLDSIHIFSPKVILMNLVDELLNGLPNAEVNFGFDEIYTDAVFKRMVDTIIENDDLEINDCYYTFSNEDWNRMLEDAELRKYNAKKVGSDTSTAVVVDKQAMLDALDEASSAATLHDRTEIIGDAMYEATKVVTYDVLEEEGGMTRKWSFDFDYNPNWLFNILSTLIRTIVKSAMTPKVMALIVVNYEIAGALNLSAINTDTSMDAVLDYFKTKMLGVFAALVKKIKEIVIKTVLNFLSTKLKPLVLKFMAKKLLEELEYYLDLLRQALECINLFGWPFGRKTLTAIEDVNYADIVQTKNNPKQSIC